MSKTVCDIVDGVTRCNTCVYGLTRIERSIFQPAPKEEWADPPPPIVKYAMYSMCTHPTITGLGQEPLQLQGACVDCPLYTMKSGAPYCVTNSSQLEMK